MRHVVCDVRALVHPDVSTVNALAQLALIVRRSERRIVLRHASRELQDLLSLLGLGDALPLEAQGQAEEWEQNFGVEEEAGAGDPSL
jgi:anti-anti-sigma regulatory factor